MRTVKKPHNGINLSDLKKLVEVFRVQISEPRVKRRCRHDLVEVLIMIILALICGCESSTDIEDFGDSRKKWLKKYLTLSGGIPSHDTIQRILFLINPKEVELAFFKWTAIIRDEKKLKYVSVDNKVLAGVERVFAKKGSPPLQTLNIFSHELGLSIGQVSDVKGGNLEGAVEYLKLLDLKGSTILADAGFSTHFFATELRKQQAHYLIPIKRNQKHSLKEIEKEFRKKNNLKLHIETEENRSRHEERSCQIIDVSKQTMSDQFYAQWHDVKCLIKINRKTTSEEKRLLKHGRNQSTGEYVHERIKNKLKINEQVIFYISSKKLSPAQALAEARMHWGIENKLHWVLDTAFKEDDWQLHNRKAASNLSVLRKVAFNLVKGSGLNKSGLSVRRVMKRASWSEDILEKIVFDA